MQETWVWSLGWEDPLEKGMAIHSSSCLENPHGQRSLVAYSPWWSQRVRHDWVTEQACPLQNLYVEVLTPSAVVLQGGLEVVTFELPWVLSVLRRRWRDQSSVPCHVRTQPEGGSLQTRKTTPTKNWICQHLDLGLSLSNSEEYMLACKPPNLWSCVTVASADTGPTALCGQRRVYRPQFMGSGCFQNKPSCLYHVSLEARSWGWGVRGKEFMSWEAAIAKRKVTLKSHTRPAPHAWDQSLETQDKGFSQETTDQHHRDTVRQKEVHSQGPPPFNTLSAFPVCAWQPSPPTPNTHRGEREAAVQTSGPFIHCAPRFMTSTN